MKATFLSIGWGTAIVGVVVAQWYQLVLSAIRSKSETHSSRDGANYTGEENTHVDATAEADSQEM